jgi:phosphoadenosine phosphosulfate reductase
MQRDNPEKLTEPRLAQRVRAKAARAERLLRSAARDFAPVVFASSLGAEDMVLTDLIWGGGEQGEPIGIGLFSLDTGRLPEETLDLIARAERRYGRRLTVVAPERADVEALVAAQGINGFYDSVAARKACCHARKVLPLKRALAGRRAWVTGLRAAQAQTRNGLRALGYDRDNDLVKLSPLADWSEEEVWAYLRMHDVPTNALHERGYPSIGCAPCTRAVQLGEDVRAGRWWWESPATKECGLHVVAGQLVRKVGAGGTAGAAANDAQGAQS